MSLLTIAYLVTINLAAFGAFASDKRRAIQGLRRIPERSLLNLAILGGAPGALAAQQLLRHKTRKQPFKTRFWLVASAQGAALVALAYSATR